MTTQPQFDPDKISQAFRDFSTQMNTWSNTLTLQAALGCLMSGKPDDATARITTLPDEMIPRALQAATELAQLLDIHAGELGLLDDAPSKPMPSETEQELRERIAADIERIQARDEDGSSWGGGMLCAAEIARGARK